MLWPRAPLHGTNGPPPEAPKGWPFSSWLDLSALKREEATSALARLFAYVDNELVRAFLRTHWPGDSYEKEVLSGFTCKKTFGAQIATAVPPAARYAIAIHGLTIPQMFAVLQRMFTRPDVLSNYATNTATLEGRNYKLPIWREQGCVFLGDGEETVRQRLDGERERYFHQAMIYALCFLVLHECVHLAYGHLEYLRNIDADSPDRDSIRRCLEHVADFRALEICCLLLTGKMGTKDLVCHAELLGFAAGVVLLVVDQQSADGLGSVPGSLEGSTHPLAALRRFVCPGLALQALQGFVWNVSEWG